jgi:hypothetical protein
LLNSDNDLDLFALHYVFGLRINRCLDWFTDMFNNHPISSAGNQSPVQIFARRKLNIECFTSVAAVDDEYGIDWSGPTPQYTNNNVIVTPVELPLSNDQVGYILDNFDSLGDDGNFGCNIYIQLKGHLMDTLLG